MESSECWWCNCGRRQSRHHLKEAAGESWQGLRVPAPRALAVRLLCGVRATDAVVSFRGVRGWAAG